MRKTFIHQFLLLSLLSFKDQMLHCLGRTSDLRERWNHIYGSSSYQSHLPPIPPSQHHYVMQNKRLPTRSMSPVHQRPMPSRSMSPVHQRPMPSRSMSPVHQRPMPSSILHPQTVHVNYGGNANQRPMPSSITYLQTLLVNYGRNTNQGPVAPSSITYPPKFTRLLQRYR